MPKQTQIMFPPNNLEVLDNPKFRTLKFGLILGVIIGEINHIIDDQINNLLFNIELVGNEIIGIIELLTRNDYQNMWVLKILKSPLL